MTELTLIVLKPDTLMRGLVGTVFDRFEKVGLKMVACKMTKAELSVLDKMYNGNDPEYVKILGDKTLKTYNEYGIDVEKHLGTSDPAKLGADIIKNIKEYLQKGPVIVTVWEGVKAVSTARKIRGATTPLTSDIGSITGDLTHDSQFSAPFKGWAIRNLVHASGTTEEAKTEIELWFGKDFKIVEYDRSDGIFF